MTTSIAVYPQTTDVPSFDELLHVSTLELHGYLQRIGLSAQPEIGVKLVGRQGMRIAKKYMLPFTLDAPVMWTVETNAWFTVAGSSGGTDALYWQGDNSEVWERTLLMEPQIRERESFVRSCLATGMGWSFTCSMLEPAIIQVAYGLIAASLAKLTHGMLYSENGAWDWKRFPATADEFLSWYMIPEHALKNGYRVKAEQFIAALREEYT